MSTNTLKMSEDQEFDFADLNLDFLELSPQRFTAARDPQTCKHLTPLKTATKLDLKRKVVDCKNKHQKLAQRIANTDELVQKLGQLQSKKNQLVQQLQDLQKNAQDIRELYEQEKRQNIKLQKETEVLQYNCNQLDAELALKTLQHDQLQAKCDEQKGPVEYSKLAVQFLKLCQRLGENHIVLHWQEQALKAEITKYCEERQFPIPQQSQKSPKKRTRIKKIESSVQTENASMAETPEIKNSLANKKTISQVTQTDSVNTRSQFTQYISTTTTRSTSTNCYIKQHHIGTNFPESQPLPSVQDMLIEICKWDQITPITPLPPLSPHAHRTIGTCTVLCNVHRNLDFIPNWPLPTTPAAIDTIKHSNSRPPSRLMYDAYSIKHEDSAPFLPMHSCSIPPCHHLQMSTFEEIWQVFGHMLLGLLQHQQKNKDLSSLFASSTNSLPTSSNQQDSQHLMRSLYKNMQQSGGLPFTLEEPELNKGIVDMAIKTCSTDANGQPPSQTEDMELFANPLEPEKVFSYHQQVDFLKEQEERKNNFNDTPSNTQIPTKYKPVSTDADENEWNANLKLTQEILKLFTAEEQSHEKYIKIRKLLKRCSKKCKGHKKRKIRIKPAKATMPKHGELPSLGSVETAVDFLSKLDSFKNPTPQQNKDVPNTTPLAHKELLQNSLQSNESPKKEQLVELVGKSSKFIQIEDLKKKNSLTITQNGVELELFGNETGTEVDKDKQGLVKKTEVFKTFVNEDLQNKTLALTKNIPKQNQKYSTQKYSSVNKEVKEQSVNKENTIFEDLCDSHLIIDEHYKEESNLNLTSPADMSVESTKSTSEDQSSETHEDSAVAFSLSSSLEDTKESIEIGNVYAEGDAEAYVFNTASELKKSKCYSSSEDESISALKNTQESNNIASELPTEKALKEIHNQNEAEDILSIAESKHQFELASVLQNTLKCCRKRKIEMEETSPELPFSRRSARIQGKQTALENISTQSSSKKNTSPIKSTNCIKKFIRATNILHSTPTTSLEFQNSIIGSKKSALAICTDDCIEPNSNIEVEKSSHKNTAQLKCSTSQIDNSCMIFSSNRSDQSTTITLGAEKAEEHKQHSKLEKKELRCMIDNSTLTPLEVIVSTAHISPILQEFDSPSSPTLGNEALSTDAVIPIEIPLMSSSVQKRHSLLDQVISNYLPVQYRPTQALISTERRTLETLLRAEIKVYFSKTTPDQTDTDIEIAVNHLLKNLFEISHGSDVLVDALVHELAEEPRQLSCGIEEEPNKCLGIKHRLISIFLHRLHQQCPDFTSLLLRKIESVLFNCQNADKILLGSALNLTQLYLLVISSTHLYGTESNPARLFIAKCLYYHQLKAIPMIYDVLCCFPTSLPHREERSYDRSDALITVIQHALMCTTYDMDRCELRTKELLSKLRFEYHFEPYKPIHSEVLENLMQKMRAGKTTHLHYAFAIFCKRQPATKVAVDVLQSQLLPLANEYYPLILQSCEYDERVATLLQCISMVLKPFPLETDVSPYLSILTRFLNAVSRSCVQEAAIQAILRLQRFGYVNCYNALTQLKVPPYVLNNQTKAMLKTFIHRKPMTFWKTLRMQDSLPDI